MDTLTAHQARTVLIGLLLLNSYASLAAQEASDSDNANPHITRLVFTSAVHDREPADNLKTLSNDQHKVYLFSELRDLKGQTVTHRWTHHDRVMAEITFEVGADRWRVWSSKTLQPQWTGEWRVSVVNSNGAVLGESSLNYISTQP